MGWDDPYCSGVRGKLTIVSLFFYRRPMGTNGQFW